MNPGKKTFAASYLLDRAGMWTSAICAIHCIVLPVLITASAFSNMMFLTNPRVENIIFGISAVLGTSSLFPSYFKHHKKIFPILVLLSGFILIGLSRFMVNESVFVSIGAASVASAHFFNLRLCKIPIAPDSYRDGRHNKI